MEDIDFVKKFKTVYNNQIALEKCIGNKTDEIKSTIKSLDEKNDIQINYLEEIYQLLRKIK